MLLEATEVAIKAHLTQIKDPSPKRKTGKNRVSLSRFMMSKRKLSKTVLKPL
jgi:hypothetical protein